MSSIMSNFVADNIVRERRTGRSMPPRYSVNAGVHAVLASRGCDISARFIPKLPKQKNAPQADLRLTGAVLFIFAAKQIFRKNLVPADFHTAECVHRGITFLLSFSSSRSWLSNLRTAL